MRTTGQIYLLHQHPTRQVHIVWLLTCFGADPEAESKMCYFFLLDAAIASAENGGSKEFSAVQPPGGGVFSFHSTGPSAELSSFLTEWSIIWSFFSLEGFGLSCSLLESMAGWKRTWMERGEMSAYSAWQWFSMKWFRVEDRPGVGKITRIYPFIDGYVSAFNGKNSESLWKKKQKERQKPWDSLHRTRTLLKSATGPRNACFRREQGYALSRLFNLLGPECSRLPCNHRVAPLMVICAVKMPWLENE